MFEAIDFEKACKELEDPDLQAWEFFVESHDVKIYRQFNEESGLYQYKIYGSIEDVVPNICAQVYMDLDYRKTWDSYVKELVEIEEHGRTGVYWNVNYPFPMSNRDYTYIRELREIEYHGKQIWVVLARSENFNTKPPVSGVVRVEDYMSYSALTSNGKGGSTAYQFYYDNPGGMIPTWLINWAAKNGVPHFLSQMQEACRGYPDYMAKKKTAS